VPRSPLSRLTSLVAPRTAKIAPGPTARVVHQALARAIAGVGPLDGAAECGRKALEKAGGDRREASEAIASTHLRMAAAQGFVTNLGGLVTLAATVPANIVGLALLQCRMVAAIASVHGQDLDDVGVRNAVLTCILGRSTVEQLVERRQLPGRPHELAAGRAGTTPATGRVSNRAGTTDLDRVVAGQVATALIGDVLGKRLATTIGKRVPVVGGVVGAGSDFWATRKVAAYAREEFAAAAR
jgi:uncharacterized protein (DUF697 family)